MRAYTTPLLVSGLGSPVQSCRALERMSLKAGDAGAVYDERWLQDLIQAHPALLPLAEIEPGLALPVPICTELAVPSGYVDNVMLTPDGGIVLVETKLWRNPEARRAVVGQVLDYAKDLSGYTYEAFQIAVRAARGKDATSLFELVAVSEPSLEEARFINAVSRNLRLGRLVLIIAGDGVQEGAEELIDYLQRHVSQHFSLSLVEMSLWRALGEPDTNIFVQPRILARTLQIERAVVRVEPGVQVTPVIVDRATPLPTKAETLSETQFDEALATIGHDMPRRLTALVARLADLGVYADVRRNLSLKWRGPDDREYHLGSVNLRGNVETDYCNWSANGIGRVDLSHAYINAIADLIPGGSMKRTPKATGWRVVTDRGDPALGELLDRQDGWIAAIEDYLKSLRVAIESQN